MSLSRSTNGRSTDDLVEHEVRADVVDVRAQHEQVVGRLHRDEPVAADLDQRRVGEHLDGGTHRGLDLDHLGGARVAGVDGLLVADQRQPEDAVADVEGLLHRAQVEPEVVGRAEPVPVEVGQRLPVLGQRLRGLAEHDPAVGPAAGEVAALAVARRPADRLDRERRTTGREPARDPGVRDGAEVVGVGDEDPLVAGLEQLVEQAGAAQRGVEVAVAGRTPLEVGVLGPADRREVLEQELGLLVLQELQRQPLDRQVLVARERRPWCRPRCGSCS